LNIFSLDIEQLDLKEAKEALSGCNIERLPGVPPFLSKKDCASVIGVSMKTINNLVESGQLPVISIPNDSLPASFDLFGLLTESPREECILRADLAALLEKLLACNKPILGP
jgi:hypothetical protein